MSFACLRAAALVLASAGALSACSYYDDGYGYGYGGVSVGYGSAGYCDPYYDDCYGGHYSDAWYGWYGDYYYPGFGVYIYDRYRRPYRWTDDHRRYWESRRHRYGGRDWNDRRWERWDHWDRRWDGRRGDRRWDGRRGDGWDAHRRQRGERDRSYRRDWREDGDSMRRRDMTRDSIGIGVRPRAEERRAERPRYRDRSDTNLREPRPDEREE